MSAPSSDPIIQKLQVLVAGTGYNFYDRRNMVRADDLLVRQRASGALAGGARALAALEVEYRRSYIPAATRDNPFPPAQALEALRTLGRLRARMDGIASAILTMSVPTQDKTWWRFRDEQTLLARLLEFDYEMIWQAEALSQKAHVLSAEEWNANPVMAIFESDFKNMDERIRGRAQFLQVS